MGPAGTGGQGAANLQMPSVAGEGSAVPWGRGGPGGLRFGLPVGAPPAQPLLTSVLRACDGRGRGHLPHIQCPGRYHLLSKQFPVSFIKIITFFPPVTRFELQETPEGLGSEA